MEIEPRQIDLTIPMLPEMELTASRTAAVLAEEHTGLEKGRIEEVKLALIEACINAFEHSQSKDRRAFIRFDIDTEGLTIRIQDKGCGFDLEQAQKQGVNRRARGESHRGWGLKLMEEMMDKVDIQSNEKGTVVTMVKHR